MIDIDQHIPSEFFENYFYFFRSGSFEPMEAMLKFSQNFI